MTSNKQKELNNDDGEKLSVSNMVNIVTNKENNHHLLLIY